MRLRLLEPNKQQETNNSLYLLDKEVGQELPLEKDNITVKEIMFNEQPKDETLEPDTNLPEIKALPEDQVKRDRATNLYQRIFGEKMTEKDRAKAVVDLSRGWEYEGTPYEKAVELAEKTKPITETALSSAVFPAYAMWDRIRSTALATISGGDVLKAIIRGDFKPSDVPGIESPESVKTIRQAYKNAARGLYSANPAIFLAMPAIDQVIDKLDPKQLLKGVDIATDVVGLSAQNILAKQALAKGIASEEGYVNLNKAYKDLGVGPTTKSSDIKKRFLELVKRVHPDKGGTSEEFRKIKEAYDAIRSNRGAVEFFSGLPVPKDIIDKYSLDSKQLAKIIAGDLTGIPVAAIKALEDINFFGTNPKVQEEEIPEFKSTEEAESYNFITGQPIKIKAYHGTDKAFDKFDKKKLGTYTGAKSAQKGFFFTSSKENAQMYAGLTQEQEDEYNAKYKEELGKMSEILGVKKDDPLFLYKIRRELDSKKAQTTAEKQEILREFTEKTDGWETKIEELLKVPTDPEEKKVYEKVKKLGIVKKAKDFYHRNKNFLETLSLLEKYGILLDSIDLKKYNYAKEIGEEEKLEGWGIASYKAQNVTPNVREEIIEMKNPFVYKEPFQDGSIESAEQYKTIDQIVDIAKEKGHDGVIIQGKEDPLPGNIYILFNPPQKDKIPEFKSTEETEPVQEQPLTVQPTEKITSIKEKPTPIKTQIKKATGINKTIDTITANEMILLKSQIRIESKTAKKAYKEGVTVTKEQQKSKNLQLREKLITKYENKISEIKSKEAYLSAEKDLAVRIDKKKALAIQKRKAEEKLTKLKQDYELQKERERIIGEKRGFKAGVSVGKRIIKTQDQIKNEVKSLVRSINNLANRNIDAAYKETVNNIINQYDLNYRATKTLEKRQKLKDFIDEQRANGETVLIPEDQIAKIDTITLNDMTVENLRTLKDTIEQIVHLGSLKKKLIAGKQARDFAKVENSVSESIYKIRKPKTKTVETGYKPPSARKQTYVQEKLDNIDALFAHLRKTEFISRALDGHQDGLVQENIIEPMQQTADKEMLAQEKIFGKLKDLVLPLADNLKKIMTTSENIAGKQLTREEMMSVYLNSQNEGNLQRLIKGNEFTEDEITKISDNLTEKEKAFCDGVFDLIDSLYPETAKTIYMLTGNKMGKVKGRYFPIVVDKEVYPRAQFREAETDLFQEVFNRTYVEKGFTKERTGGRAPIDLRAVRVIMDHLNKVIHFNSNALAVRDVQKLLASPKIKTAIIDSMGENIYAQYQPWLKSIANPTAPGIDAVDKAIERWAGSLKRKATSATLGIKISVSLLQFGSYSQTIKELGIIPASKGLIDFYRNPVKMAEFINSKSPQMKFREKTFDRDVREWLESKEARKLMIGKKDGVEVLYALIKIMDKAATYPTWLSAYNKKMMEAESNEEIAVKYADGVVRRTQPAGSIKDLAAISRGSNFKKLFTMFYTHFSNYHNQMVNQWDYLRKGDDSTIKRIGNSLVSYWWLVAAPALFATWIRSGFKERDPNEYIKGIVGYFFSGIPLVRDVANKIIQGRFEPISTPAFAGPEAITRTGIELSRKFQGKNIRGRKLAKETIQTIGYTTGLPSRQAWVTIDGLLDIMNGNTRDIRRLIFSKYALGHKSKKKKKKKKLYLL